MSNTTRPHRRLSLTLPSITPTGVPATPETPVVVASDAQIATNQGGVTPQVAQVALEQPVGGLKPVTETEAIAEDALELETVRVMAYLTSEEARILDELWLLMRRKHGKVSKSDILRASLSMAFSNQADLNTAMSDQQINTSSRHRSSKLIRR